MTINVLFEESEDFFDVDFGQVYNRPVTDYGSLQNKPSINSVTLEGALTAEDLGLGRIYYDTTENWNRTPQLITEHAAVYIYSDHEFIDDGNGNRIPIAGLKIGDGSSYLIDTPFVSSLTVSTLMKHISSQDVHVSKAERLFWDNKISAYVDPQDDEALVFSKTHYELNGEIRTKE